MRKLKEWLGTPGNGMSWGKIIFLAIAAVVSRAAVHGVWAADVAGPVFTQVELDAITNGKIAADTVWTCIAAMLVFWMNAGFGMLEAGLQQAKNCVNICAKNFVVFAI